MIEYEFLEFMLSQNGVEPLQQNVETILITPRPRKRIIDATVWNDILLTTLIKDLEGLLKRTQSLLE